MNEMCFSLQSGAPDGHLHHAINHALCEFALDALGIAPPSRAGVVASRRGRQLRYPTFPAALDTGKGAESEKQKSANARPGRSNKEMRNTPHPGILASVTAGDNARSLWTLLVVLEAASASVVFDIAMTLRAAKVFAVHLRRQTPRR